MNARQTKKNLKKQINKLQKDNDLMRRIIEDSPRMQEIYDLWNKPLNIKTTTIPFQEYKSKRFLPPDRPYDGGFIALFKRELAEELFRNIKDEVVYEVDVDCLVPTITASIFVGRK